MGLSMDRQTAGYVRCEPPYFYDLFDRLDGSDPMSGLAFRRHLHWGYWPDPGEATGTPDDFAAAAERLCRLVCDAARIRDGMRVLDVGCGVGGTIASLNERFHGLEIVGVNINPRQLERAAELVVPENGNAIRFVVGDACDLAFPAASFDAILAVECTFHFASRADFLSGAARSLRPGGYLALSDFIPRSDAVPMLEGNDPGADESIRLTYGNVNVLCPVEQYRRLGDAAGLNLMSAQNITANTMPTYPFLRFDLRPYFDREARQAFGRATSRMELAGKHDLIRYQVLSFERRAAALGLTG